MKIICWHALGRVTVLVLGAALAFVGCGQLAEGHPLNDKQPPLAMRTHCVGRLLIDLPAEFEHDPESDVELYYGLGRDFRTVKVQAPKASGARPTLAELVGSRVNELVADEHFESPSKTMLAFRKTVDEKTELIRAYKSPDMLDSFKSEILAEKGAAIGRFSARVFTTDKPESIEANLLKVAQATTAMSSPNQPGRGTCLGPLLINAGQDGEVFHVIFYSNKWPDVFIEINSNSMVEKSDGGLLKRWDNNMGMLVKLNFRSSTLRRGSRPIAGMDGEELLLTGKDHDHRTRGFSAELLRTKPASFAAPQFAISMNMGGQVNAEYVDPSWTDDQAVAIWDAITKSIRLRPGAV